MTGKRKDTRTKFWIVWMNMKQRCSNPNYKNFYFWGGRGITFDPKWKTFKGFYEDMFPSYKKGLSLDRIDNNGNYNKVNCRWATRIEQANNTRRNTFITFNGTTKTLTQWARFIGIKSTTFCQRLYAYNWSIERCLTKGGQIV